jgi:thiamine biosynthesis lipoprotein
VTPAGGRAHPHRVVRTAQIMGTVMSIHVLVRADAGGDRGGALTPAVDVAADACFAELRDADALFSPFRPDSEVSLIADGRLALADADRRVRDVAEACLAAEEETQGRFSAYWDGRFDPTGYVKGWAVEAAARGWLQPLVEISDVVAAGINAGGDLQLFTAAGADWEWTVGIANPSAGAGRHTLRAGATASAGAVSAGAVPVNAVPVLATVRLRNGAVATSGSAERGSHIRDPRTGLVATGAVSATVVDDSLTRADLWATTAVVAGIDDLSWMPRSGTRSGIVVAPDGRVRRWANGVELVTAPSHATSVELP